jgi:Amt family ammonium transporter
VFQESDVSMVRRQADISAMSRLRDALQRDRLTMFAQRIVSLRGSDIPPCYELLMRALDDEGRPVTAAPLLSAAHRYQVSSEIDDWVVPHALQAISPFRSLLFDRGIGISINVTGQSFGDPNFAGKLRGWLAESKVPPGIVTFEITETAAVSDLARADAFIRQFRAMGCRFALDDFGIGVNSLVYLKSLRVNRVKIDGSFVHDMIENSRSESMVKAIAQLAQDMGIETVAEYVESEEIMERLRRLGVDYAQGFAVARPEPLLGVLQSLQVEESARLRRVYLEA